MTGTTTTTGVREHAAAVGLTDLIKAALTPIAPDGRTLTVAQLAPLDRFRTRGTHATEDLAAAAGLEPRSRGLDLGCGIGGPARSLAAAFGGQVTGVDLSPGFIEAAAYPTARCARSDRVTFPAGDALHLPFEDSAFDAVSLQHVAMNVEDRTALSAEVRRILAPGGRFAAYDLVARDGDVVYLVYPVPWARDASTRFLISEGETRTASEHAGFRPVSWRDESRTAIDRFGTTLARPPPSGPNLGVVSGPGCRSTTANPARSIREKRLGVLSAVLTRGI